jgi:hypothetical protein
MIGDERIKEVGEWRHISIPPIQPSSFDAVRVGWGMHLEKMNLPAASCGAS